MEERKEYSVVGTVTIGTDEYRDLINDKFEAERARQEEHDHWYKCYCEKNKVEEECKKLKEELDKLKKFIKKNQALINEDGITVFMSMFGEE